VPFCRKQWSCVVFSASLHVGLRRLFSYGRAISDQTFIMSFFKNIADKFDDLKLSDKSKDEEKYSGKFQLA
jgi:hypothetical protein